MSLQTQKYAQQKHNTGAQTKENSVKLRSLAAPTYHAAGGVHLSVRDAFEVFLAAAILFGAVTHGPERCQQVLHCLKVGGHHGFFPAVKRERKTRGKKKKV